MADKTYSRSLPISAGPNDFRVGTNELGDPVYRTATGATYYRRDVSRAELEEKYPSLVGTSSNLIQNMSIPSWQEFKDSIPSLTEVREGTVAAIKGAPTFIKDAAVGAVLGATNTAQGLMRGTGSYDDLVWTAANTAGASAFNKIPEGSLRVFGGRRAVNTIIPETEDDLLNIYRNNAYMKMNEEARGTLSGEGLEMKMQEIADYLKDSAIDNIHPDDLFEHTGVFTLPDGNSRFIIDTSTDKIPDSLIKGVAVDLENLKGYEKSASFTRRGTLQQILGENSNILSNYPQLAEMPITIRTRNFDDGNNGVFWGRDKGIELNLQKGWDTNAEHTLYHEIQHAIQEIEGFDVGTNPGVFSPDGGAFLKEVDQIAYFGAIMKDLSELGVKKFNLGGNLDNMDILYGDEVIKSGISFDKVGRVFNSDNPSEVALSIEAMLANHENLMDGLEHGLTPWQMYARTHGELEAEIAGLWATTPGLKNVNPEASMFEEGKSIVGDTGAAPGVRSPNPRGPQP